MASKATGGPGSTHPTVLEAKKKVTEIEQENKADFEEMRRAWCEEGDGRGKNDKESPVCAEWRAQTMKSEL